MSCLSFFRLPNSRAIIEKISSSHSIPSFAWHTRINNCDCLYSLFLIMIREPFTFCSLLSFRWIDHDFTKWLLSLTLSGWSCSPVSPNSCRVKIHDLVEPCDDEPLLSWSPFMFGIILVVLFSVIKNLPWGFRWILSFLVSFEVCLGLVSHTWFLIINGFQYLMINLYYGNALLFSFPGVSVKSVNLFSHRPFFQHKN